MNSTSAAVALGPAIAAATSLARLSSWAWRFHCRLVGTKIVDRDGYDLTGRLLDEAPEYCERIRATGIEVCETGIPTHLVRELLLDCRMRRYEVIVLPLASNGEDIDMLISVQGRLPARPEAEPGWTANPAT